MSKIQEIKAWSFPCNTVPFYWTKPETEDILRHGRFMISKTKKGLDGLCVCKNHCAPERIKITVERI